MAYGVSRKASRLPMYLLLSRRLLELYVLRVGRSKIPGKLETQREAGISKLAQFHCSALAVYRAGRSRETSRAAHSMAAMSFPAAISAL